MTLVISPDKLQLNLLFELMLFLKQTNKQIYLSIDVFLKHLKIQGKERAPSEKHCQSSCSRMLLLSSPHKCRVWRGYLSGAVAILPLLC